MQIKNIVFDLGGVLIDWNPRYLYRKVFDDEKAMERFLQEVCTYEWNLNQDAGRTWKEATDELIAKFPQHEENILAYWKRWEEMLGSPIGETVDLLRKLKEDGSYRLLALTNWSAETFPIAQERFEFLSWFEGIVVSGEEKTRKPAQNIYKILFDRFGIEPAQSVFIDDSLANVEASEQLGMRAIHFQRASQAKKELFELLGREL